MMSPADAFDLLRSALERAGVRYAVGGSWASTAFGEPRFTNDVDILAEFTEANLPEFLSFLPRTFYVDAEEAVNAFGHGRPPAPLVRPEDILLAKLCWYRLGSELSAVHCVTSQALFAGAPRRLNTTTWKEVPLN